MAVAAATEHDAKDDDGLDVGDYDDDGQAQLGKAQGSLMRMCPGSFLHVTLLPFISSKFIFPG